MNGYSFRFRFFFFNKLYMNYSQYKFNSVKVIHEENWAKRKGEQERQLCVVFGSNCSESCNINFKFVTLHKLYGAECSKHFITLMSFNALFILFSLLLCNKK